MRDQEGAGCSRKEGHHLGTTKLSAGIAITYANAKFPCKIVGKENKAIY